MSTAEIRQSKGWTQNLAASPSNTRAIRTTRVGVVVGVVVNVGDEQVATRLDLRWPQHSDERSSR